MIVMISLLASCGGKTDETADDQQTADTRGEPRQIIPDEEFSEFEKLANAFIRPYFDDQATQSEKTIKPGENFDVYVFAEFSEQYPVSAAEYKLSVPEGITVLFSVECDSTILSLGKYDNDFMIVFKCTAGPKMWIAKYACKADEGFRGGTFETHKGEGLNYLGFTMCDEQKTMLKAKPGKAVLKKK